MTSPDPRQPAWPRRPRWDLDALRDANPIEQVVATSGVTLRPQGHGYVGCCPFHDDTTPSLSVGGVPGRFHCFGCGARGDVIDYVARITGMDFVDSVRALQHGDPVRSHAQVAVPAPPLRAGPAHPWTTSPERGWQVNQLAWEHFTAPAAAAHAQAWLRWHRGIDVDPLQRENHGEALAGYASPSRHSLVSRLRAQGVTDAELLDLDLARQPPRGGAMLDSYRGRIILPVRDPAGNLQGFLGRDTTGHPAAPKYRNPTGTPTFDKATVLYRPTVHRMDQVATVVIVEGPLDALAVAASAAQTGRSHRFAPVTASGVTVSPAQADTVLAIHHQPPVIALDADPAGRDGTARWLRLLTLARGRLALITTLPDHDDPADWLRERGPTGLAAFDRSHLHHPAPGQVHPHLPGRELVQLVLAGGAIEPVPAVLATLLPLAAELPAHARTELLDQAEREMSAQGWNPRHQFSRALQQSLGATLLPQGSPLAVPTGPADAEPVPQRPLLATPADTRRAPGAPSLT